MRVPLGDSIYIDLNKNLNEKDTFAFHHSNSTSELAYVEVIFQQELNIGEDLVKEYAFSFLDEDYLPTDYGDPELYNIKEGTANIADYVFRISQENGVLESPDFNYFPYCRQYVYRDKIENVLDLSMPHAYNIFNRNVGDELHIEDWNRTIAFSMSPFDYSKAIKEKYTAREFDEDNMCLIREYDLWSREDRDDIDGVTTKLSFEQKKDTIKLLEYESLFPTIPDGIPHAYFYEEGLNGFVNRFVLPFEIANDSLYIELLADVPSGFSYYTIGKGGPYFDRRNGFNDAQHTRALRYSKIDGEEEGDAYSDSFLLSQQEEEKNNDLMITDGYIYFRNISDVNFLRVYNSMGVLLKSWDTNAAYGVFSIRDLPGAMYIVVYGNENLHKTVKYFKTIKKPKSTRFNFSVFAIQGDGKFIPKSLGAKSK